MSEVTRVFVRSSEQPPRSAKYGEHFFRRVEKPTPAYEPDVAPLVPEPKKIGRLDVGLADAERVAIARGSAGVRRYEATERPPVRFRGKLTVSAHEEATEEAVPAADVVGSDDAPAARPSFQERVRAVTVDEEPSEPEPVPEENGPVSIPVEHRKGRGRLHTYTKAALKHREPLQNPDGIIGMQRARISDRNPRDTTLAVEAPMADARPSVSPLVIVVSGVCGLAAAVLVSGLYTSVEVTGDGVAEAYGITFRELIESLSIHLSALIVHSFGG